MLLLLNRLGAEVHGLSLPEPVSPINLFDVAGLANLCTDKRGDVCDVETVRQAVAAARPSVVIHMAAQPIVRLSFRDPLGTLMTNVMGVANVLEVCRTAPGLTAIAIVTSDKCYDNREQLWPYRENDAMGGHDPYSASKGCAELVAASFARTFYASVEDPKVVSVRAGNVIGGGDWAADRLIPDLVRAAVNGVDVEIRNPDSVRPWQHVMDPLLGYLLALERVASQPQWAGFDSWNFGPNTGEELQVSQVVELFRSGWGGRPKVRFGRSHAQEHEARMLRVDATKAKSELAWRPCTDNRGAIALAVEWFRGYHDGSQPLELTLGQIDKLMGATAPLHT